MKDLTKIYIDLSKCTEEQRKYIRTKIFNSEFPVATLTRHILENMIVRKFNGTPYLLINDLDHWKLDRTDMNKTELTYPEFIKLFEGGDGVPSELLKSVSPKLWGEIYPEFKPRLCKNILGDGLQLIWFQTSDQRPYWWWVLVDSNWNMSDNDYTLQVYDLIEDEFGSIPEEGDEDYNEEDYGDVMKCYPMIVKNDGILWGTQIENISKLNSNQ